MKTPSPVTPALTRAQIEAIVSAGVVHPDAPQAAFTEWQSDAQWPVQSTLARSQRNVWCTPDEVSRSAQTSVGSASAAADYGCVDWYIYPDSASPSDSTSEAA
jgi:hypothetical protein